MSRRMRVLWALGCAAMASCSLFSDTGSLSGANDPDGSADASPTNDSAVDDRSIGDVVTSDAGTSDAAPPCPQGDALLTDPANCGVCRHDCLGGDCKAGKCLPSTLATGQTHAHWLAVDDASVYWTDGTSIHACAKSGCDAGAATVITGRSNIFEVAAGGGLVAWSECTWGVDGGPSSGGVYHCSTSGCAGAPTTALEGVCMSGVAIDDANDLLYASSPYGTTYRCAPGSCSLASAAIVTKDQLQYPAAIAIADGGDPYWTVAQEGFSGCVSPNCIPQGARIIGHSRRNAFLTPSIAGGRGYWSVYWATAAQWFDPQDIPAVTAPGQVLRIPLDGDGGYGEVLFEGGTPTSVVADDKAFRFTEHLGGAILECPSSGCDAGPTVIANGQGKPFSLVQDDVAIYWGNYGDGRIMKLAK